MDHATITYHGIRALQSSLFTHSLSLAKALMAFPASRSSHAADPCKGGSIKEPDKTFDGWQDDLEQWRVGIARFRSAA